MALITVCDVDIAEFREDEADTTSESVASEPEVRVASVMERLANDQTSDAVIKPDERVLVPFDQISETRVPKDERVLDVLDQTASGIVEYKDVEAVKTVDVTFEFIVETAEVIALPNEVEALKTCEFVFAFMTDASELDAVENTESVFEFMEEAAELIATFKEVEALLMLVPKLDDAVKIAPVMTFPRLVEAILVLELITEARDEEAELIFVFMLEVAEFTRLASELEEVKTCEFVFAFTTEAIEVDAESI